MHDTEHKTKMEVLKGTKMEGTELNRGSIDTYGHLDCKKKGILWTDRTKGMGGGEKLPNNEEIQTEGKKNKDKLWKDDFTKRAGRYGYQAAQLLYSLINYVILVLFKDTISTSGITWRQGY